MYRKIQCRQMSKYLSTQSETMWTVLGLNFFSFQFWAVSRTFFVIWFDTELHKHQVICMSRLLQSFSFYFTVFHLYGKGVAPHALWSTAGVWEQVGYSYDWAVKLARTAYVWTALSRGRRERHLWLLSAFFFLVFTWINIKGGPKYEVGLE